MEQCVSYLGAHPKSYLVMLSRERKNPKLHNRSTVVQFPTTLAHPKSYLVVLSHEAQALVQNATG